MSVTYRSSEIFGQKPNSLLAEDLTQRQAIHALSRTNEWKFLTNMILLLKKYYTKLPFQYD